MHQSQKLLDMIEYYYDNRRAFFPEILHMTPDRQQDRVLKAFDEGARDVSIVSGHGCGKDAVASGLGLHYLSTRWMPKVVCTAPSKHQLYDVLWSEFAKWLRHMNPAFRVQFQWTKEKIFHKNHPEEWFATSITSTKENPEALAGRHAEYVFVIRDEASGIPDENHEILVGTTGTIETLNFMISNGTRLSGTFYLSHHRDKASYDYVDRWNCLESTWAPKGYPKKIEKRYGKESSIYRVRVLGLFPKQEDDVFIPYDWADAARIRDFVFDPQAKKVIGVDPARYGDDETVIAVRQGDGFLPYHVLRQKNTMEVAGFVANLANKEKAVQIFVDVIGIGAGVHDRLKELGFNVMAVNVSETPSTEPAKYHRLRDELWGKMRDWLEQRRGFLWDNEDGELIGELTTPTYGFSSDGKILVEKKENMKKRGLKSPNKADAHNLTFALPVSEYRGNDGWFEMAQQQDQVDTRPLDVEVGY